MPPDARVHVGVCAWIEEMVDTTEEHLADPSEVPPGTAYVMPMKPVFIEHCLVMIKRGGEGKYASDGHGTWSLPGGWMNFGETPERAAEREAEEEAGVLVKAIERMGYNVRTSESGEFHIVTLFIRCQHLAGNPTVMEPDKCPEVKWMPKQWVTSKRVPLFAPVEMWVDEHPDKLSLA